MTVFSVTHYKWMDNVICLHILQTQFATVCGVEWNVYAAAFTPPNGAIVRTDSVRTKAYLQNSETCMRNLHW